MFFIIFYHREKKKSTFLPKCANFDYFIVII